MNYQYKKFNWLKTRIQNVYSLANVEIQNLIENPENMTFLTDYLNQLDKQRLDNYQIFDFNNLQNTDTIANILELSRDDIYQSQINNLASELSIENLNTQIRNLSENVPLDNILIKRIEQLILSERDERVPAYVTDADIQTIKYFESLPKSEINVYL